jgi:hypothetical protein
VKSTVPLRPLASENVKLMAPAGLAASAINAVTAHPGHDPSLLHRVNPLPFVPE